MLLDPALVQRKLLNAVIERGIDKEWNAMWSELTIGKDGQEAFPIAGGQWLGESTMIQKQPMMLARFPSGKHVFGINSSAKRWCKRCVLPICGYKLNRAHWIEGCRGLEVERSRLEDAIPTKFRWDLSLLDWQDKGQFSELPSIARDRFIEARRIGADSIQSVNRDSIE